MILEPKRRKSVPASTFSFFICHDGTRCYDLCFFSRWTLSQLFQSPLSPSLRGSLIPLHFLPSEWYHMHIWGCWFFSCHSWYSSEKLRTNGFWSPISECVHVGVFSPTLTSNSWIPTSWVSYLCLVSQSCLTLCDSMDCSLPGSSVHGILQARILEWVAGPSFRGSSWPRDQTHISYIYPALAGRFFTTSATWEAPHGVMVME